MSNFTPGKWWIAPPIFDGDVIFAPAQTKGRRNEVIATCILNKADAHLIAAAPEMYEVMQSVAQWKGDYVWDAVSKAQKLLARIDGEEVKDE